MPDVQRPHSELVERAREIAAATTETELWCHSAQTVIYDLVEQLESAREIMQKLVDVHQNTYGEIDGDHLAEPFKDWLARYGSNPAKRPT